MCQFWATTFPCGCFTWRSSGYSYCPRRGSAACKISLKRSVWHTSCPRSRKALRGRKCSAEVRLPPCCDDLSLNAREKLCRKCDSLPADPSQGPTLWHCPGHLELIDEDPDCSLAEAEAFFSKAVALWPEDGARRRYLRRQADETIKGVWWSY
ncbi:hypothetical protein GGS24DRAFT_453457 [Hypoxylon argillaceum]|nr:hypothetical protein GGS24DRAFT_453457 [Hypoxylon argillaceum]KAI1148577.1 hypothetical protein F4825DRAFT_433479 [Nemania diffusa]